MPLPPEKSTPSAQTVFAPGEASAPEATRSKPDVVPPPIDLTTGSRVPHRASVAGRLGEEIVHVFVWSIKASVYISAGLLLAFVIGSRKVIVEKTTEGDETVETTYYEYEINDLGNAFDIFKTVSSVMAGPLGFVLGFYFREERESK